MVIIHQYHIHKSPINFHMTAIQTLHNMKQKYMTFILTQAYPMAIQYNNEAYSRYDFKGNIKEFIEDLKVTKIWRKWILYSCQ